MRFAVSLFLGLTVCGCTSSQRREAALPPPSTGVPVALQMQRRDDALQGQRYRTLLNFETPEDTSFVRGRRVVPVTTSPHTGGGAAEVEGQEAEIAVDSLLFGSTLPGDWTLLGTYVYPPVDASITAELVDSDRAIRVTRRCAGGQWNLLALDLTSADAAALLSAAKAPKLRLRWDRAVAAVRIDDTLLIDNTRTLIAPAEGEGGWTVRRRGYVTRFDAPGRFNVALTAAAADERGWVIDEVNATRAVLRSAGDVRDWVIYADGHAYQDGKHAPLSPLGDDAARCHATPADMTVDEAGGRVERATPGDANNDGYNERRGAYQVRASGARLQLRLSPQKVAVVLPTIEIEGLAPGRVQVVVEGRVIESVTRLPDGRVLVRLPLRIEKPTTVSVKSTPDNAAGSHVAGK